MSETNLVVTYPTTSTDRSLPRLAYPTTPYALRNNSWGLFGVAFVNGGDAIDVTQIDIEIPGGYDFDHNNGDGAPLFAGPLDPDPARRHPDDGWTIEGPRHLRWTGDPDDPITISPLKAADWYVGVHVAPDVAHATAIEPAKSGGPNATLRFGNGYSITSGAWGKSPGVLNFRVAPASLAEENPQSIGDGYPWSADALLHGAPRSYTLESNSAMAHLTQTGSYTLSPGASDAVDFENAMANASFAVAHRKVPVGTLLRADGDLEGALALLQTLGVNADLKLELYTPPSLGCVPTAKWTLNVANLPTPAAVETLVWAGGQATPSYFLANDDGYLYRIDTFGAPTWSRKLAGYATSLDAMDLGLDGHYLLAGTATGKAQLLRYTTGDALWTSVVLEGAGTNQVFPTKAVRYDPTSGRVFAGAGKSLLAFDRGDGHEVAGVALAREVIDIIPSPAGIYVLLEDRVELRDAGLNLLRSQIVGPDTVGFALGSAAVMVARPNMIDLLHPTTFAAIQSFDADTTVMISARGDATGDGVEDLVVATAANVVSAYNGATTALAWSMTAPGGAGSYGGFDPIHELDPNADDWTSACQPASYPATYTTPIVCGGDIGSELLDLVAGQGSATVAWRSGVETRITQFDGDGVHRWSTVQDLGQGRALAVGVHGTNSRAIAYGDSQGRAILYNDLGVATITSEPSDRLGRFSFYMIVPEGGFYGTHLLVAKLVWRINGVDQEARLIDWFEVVGQGGQPVLNPAYRIALTVASRED